MKTFSFLAAFILFSALAVAQSSVQSGAFSVTPTVTGFTLDKGTGERSVSIEITFDKPFDKKPKIVLSTVSIDTDNKSNVRYKIEANSVSRDGFMVKVTTWADSKIYSLGGNWLAHSETEAATAK